MMKKPCLLIAICLSWVAVGWADDAVPSKTHPDSSNWQDIFAPDLSNAIDTKGVWSVRDGLLTATKNHNLWTKQQYGDCIIDLEFKNGPDGNSGLFIYASDLTERRARMEVQILDDHAPQWANLTPSHTCGSICGRVAPSKRAVKKPGQWNRMTVWCLGPKVHVLLNGEPITQIDMTKWTSTNKTPDGRALSPRLDLPLAGLPTKGHIGLQGKHGHSDVLFRNVKIKTLAKGDY